MGFFQRLAGEVVQLWGQTQRSPHWGAVRDRWVKTNPICAGCASRKTLEVHHIEPFYLRPELELSEQNLLTLCRECHFQIGHLRDWSVFNPQVIADSAVYRLRFTDARRANP